MSTSKGRDKNIIDFYHEYSYVNTKSDNLQSLIENVEIQALNKLLEETFYRQAEERLDWTWRMINYHLSDLSTQESQVIFSRQSRIFLWC